MTMKVLITTILSLTLVFASSGCGIISDDRVSQEEYDSLLAERNRLMEEANNNGGGDIINAESPTTTNETGSPQDIGLGDGSGVYEGEYDSNGKRSGYGVWIYHNIRYEGYWENDLPNGEGVMYVGVEGIESQYPDGSFTEGDSYMAYRSYHCKWIDGYADGVIVEHVAYRTGYNPDIDPNVYYEGQYSVVNGYLPADPEYTEVDYYWNDGTLLTGVRTTANYAYGVPPLVPNHRRTDPSIPAPDGSGIIS